MGFKKKGQEMICDKCEKDFNPTATQRYRSRRLNRQVFCSKVCFKAFLSVTRAGVLNPFYGKRPSVEHLANLRKIVFKGGKYVNGKGYVVLNPLVGIREKTTLEHREVMESFLGRELDRSESVHHKDHDKSNNSISNLIVMSNSLHTTTHLKDPSRKRNPLKKGNKK